MKETGTKVPTKKKSKKQNPMTPLRKVFTREMYKDWFFRIMLPIVKFKETWASKTLQIEDGFKNAVFQRKGLKCPKCH